MVIPDEGYFGTAAPEIHICMSPAAEAVICHLIDLCEDTYEVERYERKTKLLCENKAFCFPDDVRQGDALIAFSKKSVLDVAGRLEEVGVNASVIYGSLPPEIRRRQMHLFHKKKDESGSGDGCDRYGTKSSGQTNCLSAGRKI